MQAAAEERTKEVALAAQRSAANSAPNPADPPRYQFLNNAIGQAAAGTPISQEGVLAVTYGLEEAPRYPWITNELSPTATPWVLNGVYNSALLGRAPNGFPNTNPLVYPAYRNTVNRMK